jgi:hypothetical protein
VRQLNVTRAVTYIFDPSLRDAYRRTIHHAKSVVMTTAAPTAGTSVATKDTIPALR